MTRQLVWSAYSELSIGPQKSPSCSAAAPVSPPGFRSEHTRRGPRLCRWTEASGVRSKHGSVVCKKLTRKKKRKSL